MQVHTDCHDKSALDNYVQACDSGHMELVLCVLALIALDLLAARYGFDSRILDPRDTRRWWWS